MLRITARFLHGWTRAAGAGDAALMGTADGVSEWPPSPARLFSALVAAGGTGDHRRVPGIDAELLALQLASPPTIYADTTADAVEVRLEERFVVLDSTSSGQVQGYPARTSSLVRPGGRRCLRKPEVDFVWPELVLGPEEVHALQMRAARVGYLGCSDSPAQVTVSEESLRHDESRAWRPVPEGDVLVSVPYPGLLDVLDSRFARFVSGAALTGASQRRHLARYKAPTNPGSAVEWAEPIRLWAAFNRSVSGQRVVRVGEALKGLVLSRLGGDAPAVVHGHGVPDNAPRARFLSLPFVGERHASGRIFGVMVELPRDSGADLIRAVGGALSGGELRLGDERRRLELVEGPGPAGLRRSAQPSRWTRTSRVWSSAFPVVVDRYRKGGPSSADVARWCDQVGLPAPIAYRWANAPFVAGGVALRPWQTVHGKNAVKPYGHLQLRFDRPVPGPFALGSMRSYGLGLMDATRDRAGRGLSASGFTTAVQAEAQ